jgi:F0F1-type ATP synthase membrane subunit c/vacuolar-type H+-ATPase subunit K
MANDKESDWMKDISSETICTYYYYVFVITAIVAGVIVFAQISMIARNPKSATAVLLSMPALILGVVNTLFLYIICSRALLK